jgi:hypothetical protein
MFFMRAKVGTAKIFCIMLDSLALNKLSHILKVGHILKYSTLTLKTYS